MPLYPRADTGEAFPKMPDQRTYRFLCIRVIDRGIVKTVFQGKENSNHKVMLVHETSDVINDSSSQHNGKPYLLFTTVNFYYGKKGSKKPAMIPIIEKHLKREMTPEERGWENGFMFDLESLVGSTVKAYVEMNKNGWINATSWQYDLNDDNEPGQAWERRSDWVPKEEREQKSADFNYGENAKDDVTGPVVSAADYFT